MERAMELDLVVIGGGPAGLTAGIFAASRNLNCALIEAGESGDQLTNIYPDKPIENYPGMVVLEAKEGLALINGTQFMTGIGLLAQFKAETIAACADVAAAMTLEVLRGTDAAYLPLTHDVRPHPGQLATARNLMRLLEGSEILPAHKDPASDKKVPQ